MKITWKTKPLVFIPLALIAAAGITFFLSQKISVARATAEIVQLLEKSGATAEQEAEIRGNLEKLASESQDEACPQPHFGSPLGKVADTLRFELKQALSDGKLSETDFREWQVAFAGRCSMAIN